MRLFALLPLLVLCGCGASDTAGPEALNTRTVTLPGGRKIVAEVEVTPQDMQKGMMFRDSLARGHGMLFIHDAPGMYPYWMFQCKIPLDILWMDPQHKIVEISADTPPCRDTADKCPNYGGHQQAQYVLEIGAGEARRLGLTLGQTLDF
ncbi:MAG TPA: DUF192 domain-containing protein [Bryobacteraceae bacterium]|nr:DUF192 domain-containing protein [Bryobacteraceae bacterium]